MTPEELENWLQRNSEETYRKFSAKLLPGICGIRGIRIPKLRKLARKMAKENPVDFLSEASDGSFEEIMLQGLVIAAIKEPAENKQNRLNSFIRKINNWAVCDTICNSLKCVDEEPKTWWNWLQPMINAQEEFIMRFGIVMLLYHFINADYIEQILQLLNRRQFSGYYAQMAAGWALAEAYTAFPEQTFCFLTDNNLPAEVQNKAVRKICESLRISKEEKEKIKKLKK